MTVIAVILFVGFILGFGLAACVYHGKLGRVELLEVELRQVRYERDSALKMADIKQSEADAFRQTLEATRHGMWPVTGGKPNA